MLGARATGRGSVSGFREPKILFGKSKDLSAPYGSGDRIGAPQPNPNSSYQIVMHVFQDKDGNILDNHTVFKTPRTAHSLRHL
jgi:hypothetical protein